MPSRRTTVMLAVCSTVLLLVGDRLLGSRIGGLALPFLVIVGGLSLAAWAILRAWARPQSSADGSAAGPT